MPNDASSVEVKRLTSKALDQAAAEAAHAAAAAFKAAGWEWSHGWDREGGYTPDEALLALKIRRQLDECPVESCLGSGRIQVWRFIEDEVEQVTISLDIGGAAGDDQPRSVSPRAPLRHVDQADCHDCKGRGVAANPLANHEGRCSRCGGSGRVERYVDDRDGEVYTQWLGFR